jgi:hypothetical protein
MRLWLGDGMLLGMPVVLGLCAYFYILKSGDIRWVYHEGAGLWYESRFIMIGEAVVNIVLNILLPYLPVGVTLLPLGDSQPFQLVLCLLGNATHSFQVLLCGLSKFHTTPRTILSFFGFQYTSSCTTVQQTV